MAGSASRTMLPPSPPSPPSGPPRGTNFSRRKLTHPAPPSPPLTKISISSMNIAGPAAPAPAGRSGGLLGDADELVVALPFEADVAVGLCEQRVIHTEPHIQAGFEASAALTDQDAARADELATKPLDPEHLGIGVTTVSRAADTLLVRHDAIPRSR